MSQQHDVAREGARQSDGKFGIQPKSEATGVSLVLTASGPAAGTSDEAYDDFIAAEAVRLVSDPEYLGAQKVLDNARHRMNHAEWAHKTAKNEVYLGVHAIAEPIKTQLKKDRVIRTDYDSKAYDTETEQLANALAFYPRFTDLSPMPAEDAARHLLAGAGKGLVQDSYKEMVHREVCKNPEAFTAAVTTARDHEREQDAVNLAGADVQNAKARLDAARAQLELPEDQRRDVAELHEMDPKAGVLDVLMAGFPTSREGQS